MNNMSLMEDWEVLANQYNTDQATAQKFWTDYYMQEKAVYEKMLTEPVEVEKGTVAELAEKYGMDVVRFGNLPQWDALLTEERRKELYKAQKKSMTVVKGKKIGRNDPCPCGSGKKYKQCCGR